MTDELTEYLNSLERNECFRVDATLKENDVEITQRVFFIGKNNAEIGPFIRKIFAAGAGFGNAYDRIFSAQQSGARFKHLPRIFDCFDADDKQIVIMEYVQGETLAEHIRAHGARVETAKALFPHLCDAVSELHASFGPPIIHRDLKPSNIIVSRNALTIIDFGIARTYRKEADEDTRHFGTRGYAPPEQFGFGQTDVRSDVYALGLLLRFCLTGEAPEANVKKDSLALEAVSEPIKRVIAKATAFDPAQRYASARELRDAFLAAANAVANSAPDGTGADRASASMRANSASTGMQVDNDPHADRESRPHDKLESMTESKLRSTSQSQPKSNSSASQSTANVRHAKMLSIAAFIRNVIVILVFLLFFAACTDLVCNPQPDSFGYAAPLGTRIRGYYGILFLIISPCLYLIADRRPLKKKFPALATLSLKREALICAALVIVGFIVVGTA